jgi:lipopolysaccharide transport system permease protein
MELSGDNFLRRGVAPSERGLGVVVLISSVWRQRALVWEMARREMTDMHAGQAAGAVWLAVHPLLMFAVYAFLFTVVFSVRIGSNGPSDYLVYLFSGLAPWLITQDIMSRSAGVVLANATIVKKVSFPIEVLVAKAILSSLLVQMTLFICVIQFIIISRGAVSWMFFFLPVVFILHILLLWGISLFLASITIYFRDTAEFVRVFVTINIYLMPIVYLPGMVPASLQFVLYLNPFSYLIWCYQDVLYFGSFTNPRAWIVLPVFSGLMLALGSYVFSRLRHHFSSVM